jgi:hypothetical protein
MDFGQVFPAFGGGQPAGLCGQGKGGVGMAAQGAVQGFKQLVAIMVDADLEKAKREKVLVDAGFMDSHQQP